MPDHGCHRFVRYLATSAPAARVPRRIGCSLHVDAVFFDLGGVLFDDTVWRRWLLQLLSRLGLHSEYAAFFRTWDREYGDDAAWGAVAYWPALKRFLRSAGLSASQAEEVEAAGRARFRQWEQQLRPFPYVRAALHQLAARGLHLGILAAAPLTREQVESKLSRLALANLFRSVHSARDLPRGAAGTERFAHALAAAGVDAPQAAYVGRLRDEIAVARRTGMQAVAFNPERGVAAPTCLEQYDQLPDMIADHRPTLLAAG